MSLKRVANDRFSAVNSLRPLSGSGGMQPVAQKNGL
jgi:hypothetical protein